MAQKPRPPERPSGGSEANAAPPCADAATPMGRFKSLARRLLDVPRDRFAEEQRKYDEERRSKTKKP